MKFKGETLITAMEDTQNHIYLILNETAIF